ncbi:MAG: RagB/SusD family nutrient uptake outer membrane protein [Tannerella sp.]|jgi:tetratricopeptide (TPR) repeat protein|nr:RagB/SusD family nutrient uptake outer membrane protein [Tannerella sp.]
MKIKYILTAVILGASISSCHDLSLEPKGMLGEKELFGNEFGVKKYLTGLYMYLPIEDFNYYARSGNSNETGYRAGNYWEAGKFSLGNMSGEFVNTWMKVNNDGFGYWPYDRIRDVNLFINNFPNYRDDFEEATYNSLLGEAHFIRAFLYFGLAKRYGGIPVITEVQDPLGDPEVLQVPRAKEYDTWKFIHDDLQFAIDNMKETSEAGRANKYVAAALMSRTMLYAGTIAKYTHYLGFEANQEAAQQGFAGIDPSKANEFFQYSYDAGKLIDNSGRYSLYTKNYPDKALNFANLFLDASSTENIFIKEFDKNAPNDTRLRHSYDAMMCPQPDMSRDVGAQSYPSLDLMRLYDFPDITDAEGKPIRFDRRGDIKNGMEPRMRGSMYFDGDELRGHTFSIQRGLYKTFPWAATYAGNGDNTAPANIDENRILGYQRGDTYNYNGAAIRVNGEHGLFESWGGENNPITGAFVRKYIDVNLPTNECGFYMSGQHWIVFRLGEIYLNMAEACYELGKKDEAFDYIEKIRERAGCKVTRPADDMSDLSAVYGYPIDANLQFIRDERYRELAFENHRWWDIRRWRVADRVLSNWIPRVLMCYYVLDEGKYIYLDEHERWNQSWTANKNCYYEGIPQGEINKNPNLLPKNPLR